MTNFSKSDLIRAVAATCGVSKSQADEILTAAFTVIQEEATAGKTVAIHGFGRFSEKIRPAREGRNPRTGEPVQIDEKRALTFKPTKSKAS